MKKIAIVLGVAAVATLTGCRDQDYDARHGRRVQDEPKSIETKPAEVKPVEPVSVKPQEIKVEEKHCTCAPGTKHASPCACGASDCTCVVEKPLPPPAPGPEYTTYVVQNGDYLAKISKKYNVTISSIKRINNLKDDKIRVGQKLKLPGKLDVGVQPAPAAETKAVVKTSAKKGYAPYTGATKEYVVKSGDTLGSVAYGNGINIRQLKELNKLTGDTLKVGQKLKVPAEKVVSAKPTVKEDPVGKKAAVVQKKESVKVESPAVPVTPASEPKAVATPVVEQPAPEATTEPEAVPAPATSTHVVQEGEDLTRLAVDYGVTPTVLRELNNLGENDQIKIGQTLKVPAEQQ